MPVLAQNLRDAVLEAAFIGNLSFSLDSDIEISKYINIIDKEEKICSKKDIIKSITENDINEMPILPNNWKYVRLNSLVSIEIKRGKSPKYDIKGKALAFAQKCNSKYDGIQLQLAKYIRDDSLIRYKDYEALQDLDIVINSTGGGTLGRVGLYQSMYNELNNLIYADSHVTVIRTKKSVNSFYVFLYLKKLSKYLETLGEGSTNQTELKPQVLKDLLIPLPPIEEQQRIVDKLNKIMPLIDEYEKLEKQLVELKKEFPGDMKAAILQAAMEGKLTEQLKTDKKIELHSTFRTNNEERLNIPREWDWFNLKDLLSIRTGKKDQNFATEDGTYNFYTCAKEVFKAPSYSFEGESLILPGNGANVGTVTMYNGKFEAYQRTYVLQSLENSINMRFMYYCLLENWNQYNKGKMFGSAIPYIKLGNLQNYPVPLPPIEEQQRIAEKLDKLLPLCDALMEDKNE